MNDQLPVLTEKSIAVYYTQYSEPLDEHLYQSLLNDLPQSVIIRIKRYRRWQDAQACLLGKYLIQVLLRDYCICSLLDDILLNKYGKPYVNDQVQFNISHSGELVICVASRSPIGIDIEKIVPTILGDFQTQFSPLEWSTIKTSSDPQECFYRLWTMKEAVIKADGRGLNVSLSSFSTSKPIIDGKEWCITEIVGFPGYACHVAHFEKLSHMTFRSLDISTMACSAVSNLGYAQRHEPR